jgi:hypothetical protein
MGVIRYPLPATRYPQERAIAFGFVPAPLANCQMPIANCASEGGPK